MYSIAFELRYLMEHACSELALVIHSAPAHGEQWQRLRILPRRSGATFPLLRSPAHEKGA